MPAQEHPIDFADFPRCRSNNSTLHKTSTHRHKRNRPTRTLNLNPQANELNKLLSLISTQHKDADLITREKSSLTCKTLQWPLPLTLEGQKRGQTTESAILEKFSLTYQRERHFSQNVNHAIFVKIFASLVKSRLSASEWIEKASPESILRVIMCLRIFMRDAEYQNSFAELGGIRILAKYLQKATDSYLTYGDAPLVVDILKEMTNIFQKLSANISHRESVVKHGVHKALVLLLSANDVIVLHCTLHALISLAQSPEPCKLIAELNLIETLLHILQEYDTLSKRLAAELLRLLCADSQAQEMIKVFDGIPLLLSLLHSDNLKLLWNAVWCLVQLSGDRETSDDIRTMGGLPLLLSLLHDRKFISDRATASGLSGPRTPDEELLSWPPLTPDVQSDMDWSKQQDEMRELQLSLPSACCACLTELVLNDANAQQIVQRNGLYSLGLLIMPRDTSSWQRRETAAFRNLQANAFRTLRFLFSMERNRRHFKRLFPPELFEMFIDIGHYKKEISAYKSLVEKINSLDRDALSEILDNLEVSNQNKEPTKRIGDYSVLELLGSGAFGSVYKVKKETAGQTYFALKEINTLNPSWGQSSKEKQTSVGAFMSELSIIREQLRHPNVVRYYKTFVEQEKLYIVMELIEGAPIGDHFKSLEEKNTRFTEDQIWNIFIQLVLALRYLHKEKSIVHRDLTPNNIMLGENDKVTITDFGLAKQKRQDASKLTSVVGTILYSCPEVVQNKPYGEKADVWAIGCILYQMCTLNAPFNCSNMLTLATKIVQADYEPVPESYGYSPLLLSTIRKCIEADPSKRPDIVGVAAHIADRMLIHLDTEHRSRIQLSSRLEREKRRTQKHYYEANRNMQNYHRLFLVSQERYDKLVNLASSGGATSIKNDEETDSADTSVFNEIQDTDGEDPQSLEWVSEDDSSEGDQPARSNVPRPPEGYPKGQRAKGHLEGINQQLTLEIPSKCSRDSGISSGDPSPNTPQTNSPSPHCVSASAATNTSNHSPQFTRPKSYPGGQRSVAGAAGAQLQGLRKTSAGVRIRPTSATPGTLTISPRKVREINDPISQMLNQLHKIIYITQLPPTLCHNQKRKVVERFKRILFAPQSTSYNLKNELKKLLSGSRECVDINLGSEKLARQISREQTEVFDEKSGTTQVMHTEEMITYEQMHAIIESELMESGYYNMSPSSSAASPKVRAHPMQSASDLYTSFLASKP